MGLITETHYFPATTFAEDFTGGALGDLVSESNTILRYLHDSIVGPSPARPTFVAGAAGLGGGRADYFPQQLAFYTGETYNRLQFDSGWTGRTYYDADPSINTAFPTYEDFVAAVDAAGITMDELFMASFGISVGEPLVDTVEITTFTLRRPALEALSFQYLMPTEAFLDNEEPYQVATLAYQLVGESDDTSHLLVLHLSGDGDDVVLTSPLSGVIVLGSKTDLAETWQDFSLTLDNATGTIDVTFAGVDVASGVLGPIRTDRPFFTSVASVFFNGAGDYSNPDHVPTAGAIDTIRAHYAAWSVDTETLYVPGEGRRIADPHTVRRYPLDQRTRVYPRPRTGRRFGGHR